MALRLTGPRCLGSEQPHAPLMGIRWTGRDRLHRLVATTNAPSFPRVGLPSSKSCPARSSRRTSSRRAWRHPSRAGAPLDRRSRRIPRRGPSRSRPLRASRSAQLRRCARRRDPATALRVTLDIDNTRRRIRSRKAPPGDTLHRGRCFLVETPHGIGSPKSGLRGYVPTLGCS